jgi:predicted HD phosphohydrolase
MQHGPMTAEEVTAFCASPHFEAAVRLRRADESAKDPVAEVASLDTWLSTLVAVAG